MLLNLWAAERGACERGKRAAAAEQPPGGQSAVTALAAVGFGAYAHALRSRSLKAMAAAEACEDAIGLERIPQIDGLLSALAVRSPNPAPPAAICLMLCRGVSCRCSRQFAMEHCSGLAWPGHSSEVHWALNVHVLCRSSVQQAALFCVLQQCTSSTGLLCRLFMALSCHGMPCVQAHAQQQARAAEAGEGSDGDDVPEEFLDPIMATLMRDPVRLPDSRAVVDRCVHPLCACRAACSDAHKARVGAWMRCATSCTTAG